MAERPRPNRFSRRKFIVGSGAMAGLAFVGADQVLKDGLMMDMPSLTPRVKRINLTYPAMFSIGAASEMSLNRRGRIDLNDRTFVRFNAEHELIFQHADAKFDPMREYMFSHRSGNRKRMVDKAIELGANGFDIDASQATDGEILAEHGIPYSVDFGLFKIGGVFDSDEKEVRTRIPLGVGDMLNYIGQRSNPEDPFVVEIELKRGLFDVHGENVKLLEAISRNGLPTRVFSPNEGAVSNLHASAVEYAKKSMIF